MPVIKSTLELRDTEGRVVTKEEGGLGGAYPATLWTREELVREVYGIAIPKGVSSGRYQLTLALQAVRANGKREAIPFWSSSDVWEESFTLGTIEVINT